MQTPSEYIKQDRQWPRALRIAHAQYKLGLATQAGDKVEIRFWKQIIKANT
jgi:hypothetical protein